MDPRHYTPGTFEFVANYNFPTNRQVVRTEQGEKAVLQIPGADVLWSMILSAPEGTIEDRAASLLATRYVQINDVDGVMLPEVEAAHAALVDKCMQEMRSACRAIRKSPSNNVDSAVMDIPVSNITVQENESRCQRMILFQKLLLEKIRQKSEFNRGRRADSKVDEIDVPFGDAITIRYQSGNDRQSVTMAAHHTLDDLYRRLCHASGYTKINLFAKGQKVNMTERANQKLSDIDFGGQLLVQKAPGAEVTRPLSELVSGSSVFETTVMKHFDELFSLMDSDDTISQLVGVQAKQLLMTLTYPSSSIILVSFLPSALSQMASWLGKHDRMSFSPLEGSFRRGTRRRLFNQDYVSRYVM
jgi:ubiquitin carboxyl-terminal hydrolase 34